MKGCFVFLLFLAILAGGGYIWWQANAKRVVEGQVQRLAGQYCTNPQVLTVKSEGIGMTSLHQAHVKKLVITGQELELRNGPKLAYAKLVLNNLEISPTAINNFSAIGGGTFTAKVTDIAATEYLRKRGISISGLSIPVDSLHMTFSRTTGVTLLGVIKVPLLQAKLPLNATGKLVPSSNNGQVDFRIAKVTADKRWTIETKEIVNALQVLNPVINLDDWRLNSDLTVRTDTGFAVVTGKITGAQSSLIP